MRTITVFLIAVALIAGMVSYANRESYTLTIVSTTGAVLALHEFLEIAHSSDLIAWGSDAWSSEEAFGALLAWRHVVAKVLAEKIDDGYLDRDEAETLAHKLMYRNAAGLYGIEIS